MYNRFPMKPELLKDLKSKFDMFLLSADFDRRMESALANLVGKTRATFPESIPPELLDQLIAATKLLRSKGRTVKLDSDRPEEWISDRKGRPRNLGPAPSPLSLSKLLLDTIHYRDED